MNDLLGFDIASSSHLSVDDLVINLVLGLVLALVVRWLYFNYSQTISNKRSLGNILPLLTLIVILIISVVKSSLALSLGLVGALSIVRFRSAIKEPEELIYLFLALAVGLALGADQRVPVIVTVLFIAGTLMVRDKFVSTHKAYNFMVSFEGEEEDFLRDGKMKFLETVKKHTRASDLKRIDVEDTSIQLRIMVKVDDMDNLLELIDELKSVYSKSVISFVDTDAIL